MTEEVPIINVLSGFITTGVLDGCSLSPLAGLCRDIPRHGQKVANLGRVIEKGVPKRTAGSTVTPFYASLPGGARGFANRAVRLCSALLAYMGKTAGCRRVGVSTASKLRIMSHLWCLGFSLSGFYKYAAPLVLEKTAVSGEQAAGLLRFFTLIYAYLRFAAGRSDASTRYAHPKERPKCAGSP
jgi:hypothetical protein